MCLGNSTKAASNYVNGQLHALYNNALCCARIHGTGSEPTEIDIKYATCLAEFYLPEKPCRQRSTTNHAFFAKFDLPQLEFISDCVSILKLKILMCQYNFDNLEVDSQQ